MISCTLKTKKLKRLLSILCFSLVSTAVSAQANDAMGFTDEKPLVFEASSSQWPYSYLNDEGKPEGYYIDLVGMLMDELGIPYVIKLKSQKEVLQDLKTREADLTIELFLGFNNEYGFFGRNTVAQLQPGVATPKGKPVEIKTFSDLHKTGLKITVCESSLSHHLMTDYGWEDHAIVSADMKNELLKLSDTAEGQLIWNIVSLNWLTKHCGIDNVTVSAVSMPEGECKFMSGEQHLLQVIDIAYSNLFSLGKIDQLEAKWLNIEGFDEETPTWVWYLTALSLLLLIAAIAYAARDWLQKRRTAKDNDQQEHRLSMMIESSLAHIWTYDIDNNVFIMHDSYGQAEQLFSCSSFLKLYSKENAQRIEDAIDRIAGQHTDDKGHIEEELTLEIEEKDKENPDNSQELFMMISVFKSDRKGKPSILIGMAQDITEECRRKKMESQQSLRYWALFYLSEAAVMLFDTEGYIQNINPKACEILQTESDELIASHVSLNDFFGTDFRDPRYADGFHGTLTRDQKKVEYQMRTVVSDEDEALGTIVYFKAKA